MRRIAAVVVVALLALSCGDEFGLPIQPLPDEASEATLFDFESAGLREASAFDMVAGRAVRPDQTSGWGFLFALEGGEARLRPRNLVLGVDSLAGLQQVTQSFEELREAPEEGYVVDEVLAVEPGDVLVGRSRQDPAFSSLTCRHFMKMEVLAVDAAAGTLTFRHLVNPNCDQRNLVAGSSGGG